MKTFVIIASALLTLIVTADSAEADTDAPSAQSIMHDLGYKSNSVPHLLAFSSMVDKRPLYIDYCLIAIELPKKHWCLVHAYRHPKDSTDVGRLWDVMRVLDTPIRGSKNYDHKPSKSEVEQFIRESIWRFQPLDGYMLITGQVYSATWEGALGYKPNYKFTKP
ncbi:MAG: hypothetical protein ABSD29_21450 [Verrucomicrobiota bacterium]|jgi:hypothetical protein